MIVFFFALWHSSLHHLGPKCACFCDFIFFNLSLHLISVMFFFLPLIVVNIHPHQVSFSNFTVLIVLSEIFFLSTLFPHLDKISRFFCAEPSALDLDAFLHLRFKQASIQSIHFVFILSQVWKVRLFLLFILFHFLCQWVPYRWSELINVPIEIKLERMFRRMCVQALTGFLRESCFLRISVKGRCLDWRLCFKVQLDFTAFLEKFLLNVTVISVVGY